MGLIPSSRLGPNGPPHCPTFSPAGQGWLPDVEPVASCGTDGWLSLVRQKKNTALRIEISYQNVAESFEEGESHAFGFRRRFPAIADPLQHGLDRQVHAQLPVTIKHLQGVMDLLAQEHRGRRRAADAFDVPRQSYLEQVGDAGNLVHSHFWNYQNWDYRDG